MGICSYCGKDKFLTREHIIPSFICEYQKENSKKNTGWINKANKLVGAEAKIKDVCENCNNVILCELDKHAKYVLENAGAFSQNNLCSKATLNYSYDKFLRWIFKVLYNPARASNHNEHSFHCYKDLMLGTDNNDNLLVLCGGIFKFTGTGTPFIFRIAWPPELDNIFDVRLIVIGSFAFHLLIFKPDTSKDIKEAQIQEYLEMFKGLKEISKDSKECELTQLEQTFFESFELQLLRQAGSLH